MWLKFLGSSYKKVNSIQVEYSLITKSGNEIFNLNEEYIPEKKIIEEDNDFGWGIRKIITDKFKEKFNKRAKELLSLYQKKEIKELKKGVLESGDYIVKCVWYIDIDYKSLTYKEFKEFIGDKK
jgi:hypothetical protein